MLVLSRKENEKINVNCACGRCTQVNVAAVNGNKVRIGLDAPKDVKIVRAELDAHQWPLPGQQSGAGNQPKGDQHAA